MFCFQPISNLLDQTDIVKTKKKKVRKIVYPHSWFNTSEDQHFLALFLNICGQLGKTENPGKDSDK